MHLGEVSNSPPYDYSAIKYRIFYDLLYHISLTSVNIQYIVFKKTSLCLAFVRVILEYPGLSPLTDRLVSFAFTKPI